jgi:hypothetical protein
MASAIIGGQIRNFWRALWARGEFVLGRNFVWSKTNGILKSAPGCIDFGLNAEILGWQVGTNPPLSLFQSPDPFRLAAPAST